MSKAKEKTQTNDKFKIKKKVTGVPFLKIESGSAVYVEFTSPITVGQMKKKVANFVNIVNLETGEIQKLLLGSVLSKILIENYPNDSFINKKFQIIKGEKVKGAENEYFEYEVSEIE